MKWSIAAALVTLMAALIVLPVDAIGKDTKKQITLRGCVRQGEDKGTFVLTNVTEMPPSGEFAMPEWAHGRRVVYWLKNLKDLKGHAGRTAELSGTLDSFKNSEIELKTGRQSNGALYVEFEGPGKDIKAANSSIGSATGTAGRATAEKNDVKTMLAIINVKGVTLHDDSCQ